MAIADEEICGRYSFAVGVTAGAATFVWILAIISWISKGMVVSWEIGALACALTVIAACASYVSRRGVANVVLVRSQSFQTDPKHEIGLLVAGIGDVDGPETGLVPDDLVFGRERQEKFLHCPFVLVAVGVFPAREVACGAEPVLRRRSQSTVEHELDIRE